MSSKVGNIDGSGQGGLNTSSRMSSIGIFRLNSLNWNDRIQKLVVTSLVWMFLVVSDCDYCAGSSGGKGGPEFTDLLKNSSVNEGSHVDFACNVRHLSSNRIMWLKKEDDKEVLLAINTLKITKNPRVTISMMPSSGEVTTSILYINSVDKGDDGTYHCIVNSSPMILQVGILEVRDPVAHNIVHATTKPPVIEHWQPAVRTTFLPASKNSPNANNNNNNNPLVQVSTQKQNSTDSDTGTSTNSDHTVSRNGSDASTTPDKCAPVSCEEVNGQNPDSNIFCVDMDKIWTQTRDGAQHFFSWFFTCLQTIF